jgi:hypothetical protein
MWDQFEEAPVLLVRAGICVLRVCVVVCSTISHAFSSSRIYDAHARVYAIALTHIHKLTNPGRESDARGRQARERAGGVCGGPASKREVDGMPRCVGPCVSSHFSRTISSHLTRTSLAPSPLTPYSHSHSHLLHSTLKHPPVLHCQAQSRRRRNKRERRARMWPRRSIPTTGCAGCRIWVRSFSM